MLPFDHPTNPYRHKFHPDHDNLNARFDGPATEAYSTTRQIELEFTTAPPAGPAAPDYGYSVMGGQLSRDHQRTAQDQSFRERRVPADARFADRGPESESDSLERDENELFLQNRAAGACQPVSLRFCRLRDAGVRRDGRNLFRQGHGRPPQPRRREGRVSLVRSGDGRQRVRDDGRQRQLVELGLGTTDDRRLRTFTSRVQLFSPLPNG